MPVEHSLSHSVVARNLAADSENRIHDDSVARRFGFSGGLVAGVDVYAYMTNPVIRRFGIDWLSGGRFEIRLAKPVYHGNATTVTAAVGDAGALVLTANSGGVVCARGTAAGSSHEPVPSLADFPEVSLPRPECRAEASPAEFPAGRVLGTFAQHMGADQQLNYLSELGEPLEVYRTRKIVHPGWILRMANRCLSMTVRLGPWMHVGSTVRNLAAAHYGDDLAARGRVRRAYEHKGHLIVDIDVLIVRDDGVAIALIDHVSIYRPRQVMQAA